MSTGPLLRVDQIQKSFTNSEDQPLLVLDQINFEQENQEIIALLGKSGSGKSLQAFQNLPQAMFSIKAILLTIRS